MKKAPEIPKNRESRGIAEEIIGTADVSQNDQIIMMVNCDMNMMLRIDYFSCA
jgi:hypothetical protein